MAKRYFYMVYVEGGGNPTYRHPTLEAAEMEAKRLAEKTGRKTYVLVTVKSIELDKFKVEDMRPDDELPF